jgi:Trk K+ transport system NAD-binding subunit
LLLVVCLAVGALAFRTFHVPRLSWGEGLYATYCLLFSEHLYPWPAHWILKLLYVVLPILGLAVILDAIVRYSVHLTRMAPTRREWALAIAEQMENHVILCGLGRGGFRVLEELVKLGEDVVVIERRDDCPYVNVARRHEVPVVLHPLPDDALLQELGVARAKSIIVCTSDDLCNLETALDARRANKKIRVVLRMYDQDLAAKIRESFGIDAAFSRSELAAPVFASSSADPSIQNAFYVGGRLLVVAELRVRSGSQLAGKTVTELREGYRVNVLAHGQKRSKGFWPAEKAALTEGDYLTVQTEPSALKRLHELNGGPPAAG